MARRNVTREREIKAAKEEQAALMKNSAASQARRSAAEASLRTEALAAGLKPAKAQPVSTSGATTEEKSLESAASTLGKKARWWRESIANVRGSILYLSVSLCVCVCVLCLAGLIDYAG